MATNRAIKVAIVNQKSVLGQQSYDMEPKEKSERLIEAASAILNAAPDRRLNIVVLNKALFYLDLASLRDSGATITQNAFIAIQHGPVVAKYPKRLVGQLEALGIAKQISQWDGSKPIVLESCRPHFNYLDSDAMILASAVTNFFADASSWQASDYSHENPGWKRAWVESQRTGKPSVVNMQVAMQQIIEADPWMELPLIDDKQLLAAADNADGEDW